jgi:hypothetical protein
MKLAAIALYFAAAAIGLLAVPAFAQDAGLQSMLEVDVDQTERALHLTAEEKAKVEPILQAGVEKRMAVFRRLGVKLGEKPSFSTLLSLRSQMDDIRTETQSQLSKILTEQQMYTVERIGEEATQRMRKALLGDS